MVSSLGPEVGNTMYIDGIDQMMRLPDGRTLGWATYGAPAGSPVIALHGSPDSRRIWALVEPAARRFGVRLVCPDRPGFGLSEPRPGRAVLDWPADVKALADLLGLERFAVVAISGGGEYGCACAWKLPERVSGLALFSVIGPLDGADATDGMSRPVRLTYATARRAPGVARLAARSMVRAAKRHPEKAFERLARTRPVEDREVIQRPSVREALLANLPEQFCDATSIVHELHLAGQPWPVPLGELTMPVHIFQGGRDDVHTPGMARALAAAIPHAALTMRDEFATFNFLDDLDPLLEVLAGWA